MMRGGIRRTLQGVFGWLAFRLQSLTARYGDQAPAACCGVCKPCVTTAATGLVAAAAAGGLGAGRMRGDQASRPDLAADAPAHSQTA